MCNVTDVLTADASLAAAHFRQKLSLETDCADVHAAIQRGAPPFVLLHVIGSEESYLSGHIPGAIHLHHTHITAERLACWPAETLFVVYCSGPHCNGADRAALKLALSGRPVKLMLGGITGWLDEGFTLVSSGHSGQ